MELDPKIPPSSTGDKTSFAYISARDRWPIILTSAIDDMSREIYKCDEEAKRKEGDKIIRELVDLKYQLQHNKVLTPIRDDSEADVAIYNDELEKRGPPTWFNVSWLFSECYLYRRINTSFTLSEHWKNYDVFARQKISTFRSSRRAVLELATRYKELVMQMRNDKEKKTSTVDHEEAERILFDEMCEICLWGNAMDLSLLTNLTYEDIQKLQAAEARKESEKNVLVNDLGKAYDVLKKARAEKKPERRVDFILDNAGFELYVDLILAGFLLSSGLATNVVFHPKSMPWFVSDVLPRDFVDLIEALRDPKSFYETPSEEDELQDRIPAPLTETDVDVLSFLHSEWVQFHMEGQLILRPNRFWTYPGSFWRLPSEEGLYEDLKESELVIFKGDLNYRKLTGDGMWDPATPFVEAIGPMGPGSGINVLALRTCKADVVVGLKPGEDERVRATEGGGGDSGARKWAWSGKWAVVQYSGGK